jgi:hypothetical protein
VLYLTGAYKAKPEMQRAITKAYEEGPPSCASASPRSASPGGEGPERRYNLNLHAPDDRRPNRGGTYLAACLFYATPHGPSPEGRTSSLTDAEARALQAIAWQVAQGLFGRAKK